MPVKPDDLERFLTDRLDEITAEVVGEVAARVPACPQLRRGGLVLRLVRDALSVYTGGSDKSAVLDAFRDLGAVQARAGQEVRQLESALRAGARVLISRTAAAASRLYPPTMEFIAVMEHAFTAEHELVAAAMEGHQRATHRSPRIYSLVTEN